LSVEKKKRGRPKKGVEQGTGTKEGENKSAPIGQPVVEIIPPEGTVSGERAVDKALPATVFLQMENADETAITEELKGQKGEEATALVYSISIRGKSVTNLSYDGVKEAIRYYAGLGHAREPDSRGIEIVEHSEMFREGIIFATVKVRDNYRKLEVLGASSCPENVPFAIVLAVNKAERNALRKLIPEKMAARVIKEYIEKGKVKRLEYREENRVFQKPGGIQVPTVQPSVQPAQSTPPLQSPTDQSPQPKRDWFRPK